MTKEIPGEFPYTRGIYKEMYKNSWLDRDMRWKEG